MDPTFQEKIITRYTVLSTLMDTQIFTREELFTAIDSLPNDHPRKAEFIMEKAGITGWREKNAKKVAESVKRAEKFYEEAYALAVSQDNKVIANLSLALRARLLEQKKRIKESWQYGSQVDSEQLPQEERKWFGEASKKWKKAAEEKPKEKAANQSEKKKEAEKKAPAADASTPNTTPSPAQSE